MASNSFLQSMDNLSLYRIIASFKRSESLGPDRKSSELPRRISPARRKIQSLTTLQDPKDGRSLTSFNRVIAITLGSAHLNK